MAKPLCRPVYWLAVCCLVVLSFIITACGGSTDSSTTTNSSKAGGSSNPSTATIYINEHEGNLNGQDAPQLDKFWFAKSSTDQTFTTSYSISLAPGSTVTWTNQGDDPQKLTITGPSSYSTTHTIPGGPNGSTSIKLPTAAGDYTFISDPTTSPQRPGGRGGVIHIE